MDNHSIMATNKLQVASIKRWKFYEQPPSGCSPSNPRERPSTALERVTEVEKHIKF